MASLPIFQLASHQANWLNVRQQTVANNIANATTPGFKASEVESFTAALDKIAGSGAGGVARTDPRHLASLGNVEGPTGSVEVKGTDRAVSLEREMVAQTELRQAYELNTSISKAFHRMILSVAKP